MNQPVCVVIMILLLGASPLFAQAPQVCVKKVCVDVDIVKTNEDMALGLSGRKSLAANQGMLFIFAQAGSYGFWMKDMNFNLDIVWLDDHHRVVDMKTDFIPCTPQDCPVYKPKVDAKYVLEVNAGYCRLQGIGLGKTLDFRNISE